MYNPADAAERIKTLAKQQKISVKQMLENCEMNKNVLSTMTARGSMPKADNIARIADYLDCSVDYLLGRTENPLSHKANSIMDDALVLNLEQRATPQIAPDAAKQHTKGIK